MAVNAKAIIVKRKQMLFFPLKTGEDNKSPVGAPGAPWATGIPLAARLKSRRQSVYRHPGGLEDSLTCKTIKSKIAVISRGVARMDHHPSGNKLLAVSRFIALASSGRHSSLGKC